MSDDQINYDQLMQSAHRGLIRRVLQNVEEFGLPGEHHFFIIFDTSYPGVRISERLRVQYPQELTIVIQNQFSNLKIFDKQFEIQLSFNRIPELLTIPFDSITGFVDPSVPFGLQLSGDPAAGLENSIGMLVPGLPKSSAPEDDEYAVSEEPDETIGLHEVPNTSGTVVEHPDFWPNADREDTNTIQLTKDKSGAVDHDTTESEQAAGPFEFSPAGDKGDAGLVFPTNYENEEKEPASADIVQLDAFRKKSK